MSLSKEKVPAFWDLLPEKDQQEYKKLKTALDVGDIKRNRGHRIEAFDKILDAIRRFSERGDDNDWKRFLVCGICWMDDMIAINTRQLRILISKCKSSINGSLQKLGYTTNPSHSESWKFLFERIPVLKDNYNELRQWTIRKRCSAFPQQIVIYPADICSTFQSQFQTNEPNQLPQASPADQAEPRKLIILQPGVYEAQACKSGIRLLIPDSRPEKLADPIPAPSVSDAPIKFRQAMMKRLAVVQK